MLYEALANGLISIHAPREGSDGPILPLTDDTPISIHAPREGSDLDRYKTQINIMISIHAPREGSDYMTKA